MDSKLPDTVMFRNEKGILVEQRVVYDWKPTLCNYCQKYGHSEEDCRKKQIPKAQVEVSNKLVEQKAKQIAQHPPQENGDKIQQVTLPSIGPVTNSHQGKQNEGWITHQRTCKVNQRQQ